MRRSSQKRLGCVMFCVQLPVRLELLLCMCVSGVSSEGMCNLVAFDCTEPPAFCLLICRFLAVGNSFAVAITNF